MRIPILRFTAIVAGIVLSLVIAPAFSHADTIVYDTTNLSIGLGTVVTTSPSNQLGNQVTLDGSLRVITKFDLYYQGFVPLPGQPLNGQGTVTVRFWENDGEINGGRPTPKTLLYESTAIPILSGSLGIQILSFDNLAVKVPDSFTWTAQFGGIDRDYNLPGGLAPVTGTVVGSEVATWIGPGTPDPSCFAGCWVPSGTNHIFEATLYARSGNLPPVCSNALAFPAVLWTPNHQFVPIIVMGVTDPDGDAVTITVTGATQDEPVNAKGDGNTSPDAVIEAGAASVRAERSGNGNGRVYQVSFKAEDGKGSSCTGAVTVGVPHSMKVGITAIDDGQVYVSTPP